MPGPRKRLRPIGEGDEAATPGRGGSGGASSNTATSTSTSTSTSMSTSGNGLILPNPGAEDGDAEMPRAEALSPDLIQEVVERALADAEGGTDAPDAFRARVERAANSCPGFAEAYPKLLEVACSSTSRERASAVRGFLPMMLAQMRAIDARSSTFEDASRVVGIALGERFLPPKE